jgi:hypothetical protein
MGKAVLVHNEKPVLAKLRLRLLVGSKHRGVARVFPDAAEAASKIEEDNEDWCS